MDLLGAVGAGAFAKTASTSMQLISAIGELLTNSRTFSTIRCGNKLS